MIHDHEIDIIIKISNDFPSRLLMFTYHNSFVDCNIFAIFKKYASQILKCLKQYLFLVKKKTLFKFILKKAIYFIKICFAH